MQPGTFKDAVITLTVCVVIVIVVATLAGQILIPLWRK